MRAAWSRRQFAVILSALVVSATLALQAQKIDVTGDWAFTVETGAGSGSPAVTLKQDGEKLTGTYSGQLGNAPLTGTVKGTAIQFSFNGEIQGQSFDVNYEGTVDGATMKGSMSGAGGQLSGTFTAKKK
ncbi:MAG: hypothetical protein R2708_16425 [Vicinamibacterales bacterium]